MIQITVQWTGSERDLARLGQFVDRRLLLAYAVRAKGALLMPPKDNVVSMERSAEVQQWLNEDDKEKAAVRQLMPRIDAHEPSQVPQGSSPKMAEPVDSIKTKPRTTVLVISGFGRYQRFGMQPVGLDLIVPVNTSFFAPCDGMVKYGVDPSGLTYAQITGPDGWDILFANVHNQFFGKPVAEARAKRGDLVAAAAAMPQALLAQFRGVQFAPNTTPMHVRTMRHGQIVDPLSVIDFSAFNLVPLNQ